jgi:Tol biopolymer transport system component
MSLPDLANADKPTVFTGTRTYKTDNTHLTGVPTGNVADYDPAWSPDGSRLAFTGVVHTTGGMRVAYQHAGDIWSMNPDGSGSKKLTTSGEPTNAPSWKPDGTALAFTETTGGVSQLAAISPDGSDLRLLKDGQAAADPAWSPDGTKVAFDSFTLPGDTTTHSQIAVLDLASGTVTQLTSDPARDLYFPSWAPDGATIAFEAYDTGTQDATIQKVAATGGTPVTVTSGHHPAFSPSGTTLAFNKTSGNGGFDVFTIPVAGGATVQVTNSPNDEWAPSWSRDGSTLVYVSDERGSGEIWSKKANGTGSATRLSTTTSGFDGAPAWSPPLSQTTSQVFVADADGSHVTGVTLAIDGGNPAWSPDGQRIAFTDGGHVFTIQPNGLGLTPITTSFTGTTDADPSWSPDGTKLAFSGRSTSGDAAIYTINPANGTGLTHVVGGPGDHDVSPVWSPVGSRIAFLNGGNVYVVGAGGTGLRTVKELAPDLLAQSLDWGSVGAPDTRIDSGPNGTFGGHDAAFTFSSTRAPATFECMLEATVADPSFAWSGCGTGSAGSKTYSGLTADTYTFRVRASTGVGVDQTPASSQFTVAPPAVTVSLAGAGAGTVTSNPAGIRCSPSSPDCIHVFAGPVTLTAKADGLSTFAGWSGDCSGVSTCTVQAINSTKHVTATFDVSGGGPPPCSGAVATTKTVANWSLKGCFVTSGSTYTTDQLVELNGLKVYPTDATLTFDPTAGTLAAPVGSHVTLLAGPTTVGGRQVGPVTLSVGALSLNLKAATNTLAPPGGGSLLGLPLCGSVILSAPAAGTAKVDVPVQLPAVLGNAVATAHLASTTAGGLQVTAIAVGPVDVTLATLFRVKGASFSYQADTGWSAAGTVQVPGGAGSFSATFGYAAGVLQKADIVLTKVSVVGFLDASTFQLHYLNGNWTASAQVNGTNTISGSMTFQAGALQTLHLQAAHVSVFGLVGVNGFDLSYDSASGWTVTGQVAGASISGTFGYTAGVLTQAHVVIASLKVGGAFGLSGLDLTYDSNGTRDHWHGVATLDGPGSEAVTADFALVNGVLSSASLDVPHASVLGVLDVSAFHFAYHAVGSTACFTSASSWGVTGTVTVPGAASFALDAGMGFDAAGALACGHLHVAKAKLGALIDVNDLLLDVVGGGTWSGSADVVFPGGLAVKANVAFVNGVLTQLGGTITAPASGLPLGPSGIFLKGGSFQLQAGPPWVVTGGIDLTGGPNVPGLNVAAIGINGQLQLRFPGAGQAAGLRVAGQLRLANLQLSEAFVDYSFPSNIDVGGCLGTCAAGLQFGNGLATVKASIEGKVRGTTAFQVTGTAETSLHFAGCVVWCIDKTVGISGSVIASNVGVAACGHITGMSSDWSAGFGYKWGGSPQAFSGCSLGSYQSIPTSASVRRGGLARTAYAVTSVVPAGLPVQAFRFTGVSAPPFVTLTGPQGESISARNDTAGVADGHVIMLDPDTKETLVLVDHPSAGTWTATLQGDSSALASAREAAGLPAPDVSATVTGAGTNRTLAWSLTPVAGQVVRFVENGANSSQVLATASGSGSVGFSPAAGAGGTRTIVAEVSQDGVPRASIDVASYDALSRTVLAVTKQGLGTVTSFPAGISCGLTCTTDVTPGQSVTLVATPASGMRFAGWGGLCAGLSAVCSVTPAESGAVVASFVKLPPPTLTRVSPTAVKPGVRITLSGTQLLGTSKVAFGKVLARTFTVVSSTTLTVVVPTGALTGKITVTAPSGAVTGAQVLKVIPVVSSLAPTSARRGTRVTIKGSALTGATRVTIGGVAAKIVSTSWTAIVVVIPSTGRTGRVVVTTPGGTATSSQTFTVKK